LFECRAGNENRRPFACQSFGAGIPARRQAIFSASDFGSRRIVEEPGGFIEAARLAAMLAAMLVEGGAVFTI